MNNSNDQIVKTPEMEQSRYATSDKHSSEKKKEEVNNKVNASNFHTFDHNDHFS